MHKAAAGIAHEAEGKQKERIQIMPRLELKIMVRD
jgi:hypothetical protein